MNKGISRRNFVVNSFGLAAAFLGARWAQASTCAVSPQQTSGPFIPNDFPFRAPNEGAPFLPVADTGADLVTIEGNKDATGNPLLADGQIIYIYGKILDEACKPLAGATVYLWQADVHGHYNHQEDTNVHSEHDLDPNFQYRAVLSTDAQGRFQVRTIKPKYYPLDETGSLMRTAHLHWAVMHPECERLVTQSYFEGDALEDIAKIRELNSNDIILAPRGRILPQFQSLIVDFKNSDPSLAGPQGELTLTMKRLPPRRR